MPIVGTQIANPVAVALFDGGRGQILVNLGSKNALLLRKELREILNTAWHHAMQNQIPVKKPRRMASSRARKARR